MKKGKLKFPTLKMGDVIEVTWLDSNTKHHGGWEKEVDFFHEDTNLVIKSVSFFIGEKDGSIKLAADRFAMIGFETEINRTMTIPVGCIMTLKKLKS